MIIKSTYRAIGGLEAHLLKNDTNERVLVRRDMFRSADDLHTALRLMDGIARSNPKTKRSFIHVVISPGHALSHIELNETLTMIEAEHDIAPDAPRAVVQHDKGDRPDHFHVCYSIVDLATGRANRSQGNYKRDELISRRLELRFNEEIVPGPRLLDNIAALRKRGFDDEADRLAQYRPRRAADEPTRADREQASRLAINIPGLSGAVFALFEDAERDLEAIADLCRDSGYAICRGRTATLILEEATGYSTSLVRLLRREAKAAGRPLDLKEQAVSVAFIDAKPMDEERDLGLQRAKGRSDAALEVEMGKAVLEATADGDIAELKALQAQRRQAAAEQQRLHDAARQESLRARRDAILRSFRERDATRRRRVDRAFRHARLFGTPALRRLAFGLAAAGILMTGAGLTMAIVAGAATWSLLPSRAGARRSAALAAQERRADARARWSALRQAQAEAGRTFAPRSNAVRFSFDHVAKPDRILAGFYAQALIDTEAPGAAAFDRLRRVADALGPEIVDGLTRLVERGSPLQVSRLRHWYRGVPGDQRDYALESALCRNRALSAQPDGAESSASKSASPIHDINAVDREAVATPPARANASRRPMTCPEPLEEIIAVGQKTKGGEHTKRRKTTRSKPKRQSTGPKADDLGR